jgi:dTDP-glucose 4,6-dehydratase
MKIVITGGAGFAGSHVVEHFLRNTEHEIIIFDRLTYASSGLDRLRDIKAFDENRVRQFAVDFTRPISPGVIQEVGDVDYIIHMGAETHVDNSIKDPELFVRANVIGTMHMLEYARKLRTLKMFINFSTDEVFGPAPEGYAYKEDDTFKPSNPYAAAKAGAVCLGEAWRVTYRVPVVTTFTMNLFGERQHPEKFIPLVINKVLSGEEVTIHANADKTKAGSRFYLHCRNMAQALQFILMNGKVGERYNIVGEKEVDNLNLAQLIAEFVGQPLKYVMTDFHSSRPGHDLRYALDGSKLKEMGFEFNKSFEDSLHKTVTWTLENDRWLKLQPNE